MNLVLWTLAVRAEQFGLLRSLRTLGYEGVEIPITRGNGEDFGEIRRVLDGEGLQCTTFTGTGLTQEELDRSAAVLREACAYAAASGTTLCIEFMSRFETYLLNTTAQAVQLADDVGANNIGLVYDTHHAHLEEDDIAQALTLAGGRIRHVHFSESHRGTLAGGLLDWPGMVGALKAIGYDGWLMVEAFSTEVAELAQKAKVWRNTFVSRDQVAEDGVEFVRRIWA